MHADNYKQLGLTPPNKNDNTLAWLSTGERVLTPTEALGYRDFELYRNQQYINNHMNSSNTNSVNEVVNNYSVNVNVADTNSSAKQIAKAVVKAIGGKV